MVQHCSLGGSRCSQIVVDRHSVQELGLHRGIEIRAALLDQAQPKMNVAEQLTLVRGSKQRASVKLERSADVVQQGTGKDQVGTQPGVNAGRLATQGGDVDRVLEEPACVVVMPVRRRGKLAKPRAQVGVGEKPCDEGTKSGMVDLGREELEKAVELVEIASRLGNEGCGISVGLLEVANVELQPIAESLDSPEHANGVPLVEPPVEELDVVPHAGVDPSARIDQLEGEIRGSGAGTQTLLAGHREDRVDHPVLNKLLDRDRGFNFRHVGPV